MLKHITNATQNVPVMGEKGEPSPYSCAATPGRAEDPLCCTSGLGPAAAPAHKVELAQFYMPQVRETHPECNIERSRSVYRVYIHTSSYSHLHDKWRSSTKVSGLV